MEEESRDLSKEKDNLDKEILEARAKLNDLYRERMVLKTRIEDQENLLARKEQKLKDLKS